jgi:hypothetical protein
MKEFARNALVTAEAQLSSEDRLLLGLTAPEDPRGLTPARADKVTLARIRYSLSEISFEMQAEVRQWLRSVAADSPARALELYMQLLEFSVPKLKALAVDVTDNSPNPRQLSYAELQKIVSEQ